MRIDRREFLASVGGFGFGIGLGGVSHWLPLASPEIGPEWSPGREEFVPSTCLLCPAHCGIRGRLVDGRLVGISGNPLHPVNRGGLCPKGLAGIQLLYHPGRLTGPVERVGPPGSSQFRRVSWEDALGRVAATLADLRAQGRARSVVWLTGHVPGVMGELLRRFGRAYGSSDLLRDDYRDGAEEVLELSQGIGAPPAFDLEASDLVLSFGAALSEAWWCLPQAARARDAGPGRGPRWVQIDARHSRTAARADEWVPIRPGAYGTLALGLAYVILKEGLYDAERVHERVEGIEDRTDGTGGTVPGFRTLVLRYGRTEDVSERTGVPAETIVRLAKSFGTALRPVALWDQAVSWRTGGLADAMAIHALNILIGALNRPGGVLVQPPLPVPSIDGSTERGFPGGDRGPTADLALDQWAGRVASGATPPPEVLFLYYANPAASAPNASEVAAALERVPLLVSFSPFLDESARYAHLVLPDHTYLERWQDAPAPPSVPIPVWGLVQPMVSPIHDTRASGDLILDMAARIGGEVGGRFPWTKVEEIVRERGRALAAARGGSVMAERFRRGELRELEARGWWLPHGRSPDEFWSDIRGSGGWFDPYYDYHDRSAASQLPGGRARVFPAAARERIRSGADGLAEGFLPVGVASGPGEGEDGDLLHLIPYRVMTLASGGTALMPWLLENLGVLTGDSWETWAEVNPETGRRLGLSSGQLVRIESASGRLTARLRFFPGAQPGVVNVPYGLHTVAEGWGRARGDNPLRAVGARRDRSTGLPDWYSTRVRVVPA
ncbi:MAG: molybdopterin-dependent oxidoreductase [Acidobacteriota bacterium]